MTLKIGLGGNFRDNMHQGGIGIGVSETGELRDCAYTEFQDRYPAHPTSGVTFKGYVVPEVPRMLEVVRALHSRIPQVGMISGDVTIDDKGNIVIVELNFNGQSIWYPQMMDGLGAFGDDTAAILRRIGKGRKAGK